MNISYNWLKDYLDFDLAPEEVAAILTGTGLEVESVVKFESVKGGLEGLKNRNGEISGETSGCRQAQHHDGFHWR
jgi:phenylalanyl-tRNA synthetase beta chain